MAGYTGLASKNANIIETLPTVMMIYHENRDSFIRKAADYYRSTIIENPIQQCCEDKVLKVNAMLRCVLVFPTVYDSLLTMVINIYLVNDWTIIIQKKCN